MWTALAAIAGLATTILAYFINPGRRRTEELKKIFRELDQLYVKRDVALEKNDSDTLTFVLMRINVLRFKLKDLL